MLHVFLSACNATPLGHAHLLLPPGANKQRWLHPPLFKRHEDLFTAEILRKKDLQDSSLILIQKELSWCTIGAYLKAKLMTLQMWLCIFAHSRRVGNRQETAALSKIVSNIILKMEPPGKQR